MADQVAFHAVLNRPGEAVPPSVGPPANTAAGGDGPTAGPPEHALSLSGADSVGLPRGEVPRVSEKFEDLLKGGAPGAAGAAGAVATHPAAFPAPYKPSFISSPPSTPSKARKAEAQPPTPTRVLTPRQAGEAKAPAPPAVEATPAPWEAEAAADAAAARAADVAAAFAGLPRVRPRWEHRYLKILLVGEDGLGKTTFVRNMFAAFASDIDFPVADASGGGAAAADAFAASPERLCTELSVRDDAQRVVWHYLCQDTPGYGDFEGADDAAAQRAAVLDHVAACSQRFLDAEVDPGRAAALGALPDSRVDVALYFLPPHRLRRTDLTFIRALGAAGLPVVPILAKADAMTPEELREFRAAVAAALARQQRSAAAGAAFSFSDGALEAAGARHGPPFAVVASATVDRGVGRFWPVRAYPWGRCEALLAAHSDLPALRRLLFETGYWELKAATEEVYLRFRTRWCEAGGRPGGGGGALRAAARLAAGTALAVAAVFVAVNAAPLVRSGAVRAVAARRVKAKVGAAVDTALDAADEVKGRVEDTARATREAAGSALREGRRAAAAAAEALETPAVREAREAAERGAAAGRRPWWRFWRRRREDPYAA